MHTEVYTDGGCSGNPGRGAWAFVILSAHGMFTASGGERFTTNNRMELTAVIRALEHLESLGCAGAVIHTDSQYVQKGMTAWIRGWIKNGWRTADRKPVKNEDLWRRLKALADTVKPTWVWVRGHAGNVHNELCDSLVRKVLQA